MAAAEFIAGADFSHLAFFESKGIVYKEAGQPRDGLDLLQRHGVGCVRLRLFTSSAAQAAANPYNSINNLEYTLPLAVRVKRAGLQLALDFHYSDSWADPGKQTKPAAWAGLSFDQLEQRMYEYNRDSIAALKAAGAVPDYVQVGNEITPGLLWPEGRVGGANDTPGQWSNLGRLLKAAIRGVRESAGDQSPRLVVHIDRGGDWAGTQWFFDHLRQQEVDFDIIGLSYYPFWHGTFDQLSGCLTNAAKRYGKPVLVAETAFPWATNAWNGTPLAPILGIRPSVKGQVDYLIRLAQVVRKIPGGLGIGIWWWGSEYQRLPDVNLAGFEQRSFFDYDGNVLPVAEALGQLTAPLRLDAALSGGGVRLTWPLSGAGMALWTSSQLAPPGAWLAVTNAVQGSAAGFSLTLPLSERDSRFYRLQGN